MTEFVGNPLFASGGITIFEVMNELAQKHKAINLGQGAPDEDGAADIREAAARALMELSNQYPPLAGVPELLQAVADHNKRFYGIEVDPKKEVLVSVGATEGLADVILGLVAPGDEVILIEPLYDSYLPMVKLAGGIPKLVRVTPPHWELPREELAAAFSEKTKLILLNSPQNPCSKVYGDDELQFIADLCIKHDVIALCDEVYEHLVFDGRKHKPLMTFPGMHERTVRIGSAGKTFSLTGWKIGYITACAKLMEPIKKAHQFLVFTVAPDLQHGVAYGLNKDDAYFENFTAEMQAKRDYLMKGLKEVGFDVLDSQGTYFITCDFRPLGYDCDDVEFCQIMIKEAGVVAIPVSAFYQGEDGGVRNFVRFCFCKDEAKMAEAIARMKKAFAK
ncbi:MAG: aminotransferase [Thalassospira sp.]|uniref:aminotransferase n=1 Tax=Thalassospira sp. TaxID=1912094 RepID=UPI001B19C85D|nr:aminotransferase [Thalassospira sp.]MBO6579057.1 aminotransferase [Thalassospira sp.]MBO6802847.1 aminotransferase [Thalassospira sp.]MBO6819290.1 aminotransferase [Thalassospira sp.]MBO6888745.1 aminotransferase [Thalassospira sp.]